ncbi:CDP-alcohol phosphatidyltransferase family protein [uncultured Algibacter sp.]|uniref:CDP-alcohol phosphatidyltransferase family protein n=1 Tax=uncultured Algibacter sp. TaxID=298659 RepID=UPI002623BD2F|nr:CDP-alcohol phosphatidyltransferase family protein [uncultured Algibacter sp.]
MSIPIALIIFRLMLVPIILAFAYFIGKDSKLTILILMYLGLLSDILDGIIARKQNISSEKLRRMDSQTDMVFWLSMGFATWLLYPELIYDNGFAILVIISMEIMCYTISFIKFKKETCTHAFLSKLWAISLLVAFTSLIGFSHAGIPFAIAVILGFISYIDVVLIILILPKWTHDIPSAYHAYLVRKGIKFKRNEYLNG